MESFLVFKRQAAENYSRKRWLNKNQENIFLVKGS